MSDATSAISGPKNGISKRSSSSLGILKIMSIDYIKVQVY